MRKISTEDALLMLAKWTEERAAIRVVMSPTMKIGGQPAVAAGIVEKVLPHSRKALLTLRDENGDDVGVTVSLAGAEWEYEDAGGPPPDFVEIRWVRFLAATLSNGSRYVFGEPAPSV